MRSLICAILLLLTLAVAVIFSTNFGTVVGVLVALLAIVLPGVALVRREEWERGDPAELAAVTLAASAAFWAVAIWFPPFLGLSLTALVCIAMPGALLVLVARRSALGRVRAAVCADRVTARRAVLFVLGVVAARLLFTSQRFACSVGDMTAHAYMTELIVLRDGLPTTHEPLLAISDFGQFPPGFHTPSALLALLAGLPSYRTTMYVLVLAAAAVSLSLYALLRGLGVRRGEALAGAAGALFLTRNPQFFLLWGGGPSLLGAAILLLAWRDALRWGGTFDLPLLLRCGLLLAGGALVHPLLLLGFAGVVAGVAAIEHLREPQRLARWMLGGVIVAAVATALLLPYLSIATLSPTTEAIAWAHNWFRSELDAALRVQLLALQSLSPGGLASALSSITWPFYILTYLGVVPSLLLAIGLVICWIRGPGAAARAAVAVLVVNLALLTVGVHEALPVWPWLYPMRIGIWLVLPVGVAVAASMGLLAVRLPGRRTRVVLVVGWLVAFALEGWRLSATPFGSFFRHADRSGVFNALAVPVHEIAGGTFWMTTFSRDNAVLTRDDLVAFSWIAEHTDPDAVFEANYGDGGNLLTPIAHRKTRDPHYYFFFYKEEFERWKARTPAGYVYIGSEPSPRWPRQYTAEALDPDPRYRLVFRSGTARVYRVLEQPTPATREAQGERR